jgi:hypothetical protein
MPTTEKIVIAKCHEVNQPPTCTRFIIASLYLISLTAGAVVLSDWIEGRLVTSEEVMLVLVLACVAVTNRMICQRYDST